MIGACSLGYDCHSCGILRGQVVAYDETTGMISIRQHKDIRKPKIRLVPATPMAVNAYKALAAGKQKGLPLCTNRKGGRLYDYGYWLIPAIKESDVRLRPQPNSTAGSPSSAAGPPDCIPLAFEL